MRNYFFILILIFLGCKEEPQSKSSIVKKEQVQIQDTLVSTEEDTISTSELTLEDLPPKEKKPLLAKLILDEIENSDKEQNYKFILDTISGNYRIRFYNDIDPYSVSFDVMHEDDFNNDGIKDYIVNRVSEGMLGGNHNSNANYSFFIMKNNREYQQEYSILEYAPFSYNTLDNVKVVNNKLIAEASKNFRYYMDASEDSNSKKLVFEFINGNVYEKSYLTDCELANLESKTIFGDYQEVSFRRRGIDMNNYTETIEERYVIANGKEWINAELSGCDNLYVDFSYNLKTTKKKEPTKNEYKEILLKFLEILKDTTQFSDDIDQLITYYENHPITDIIVKSVRGYQFSVFTRKDDKFIVVGVNLEKLDNPKQTENWEITNRMK